MRVWRREHADVSEGSRRGWMSWRRRRRRMAEWRYVWDDDASNFPADGTPVRTARRRTVFPPCEFSVNKRQQPLFKTNSLYFMLCVIVIIYKVPQETEACIGIGGALQTLLLQFSYFWKLGISIFPSEWPGTDGVVRVRWWEMLHGKCGEL